MAKKEDIKKLEENWKQLKEEDKEREQDESRNRPAKKDAVNSSDAPLAKEKLHDEELLKVKKQKKD